jgi:glycosyltransferase involved in cell wall biosynthesis
LYEALASKTPFISLSCGNAAEIASWSGGGVIAPTLHDDLGYASGSPDSFSSIIEALLIDEDRRSSLAETGYRSWCEKFSWAQIVNQYEALYLDLIS